MEFPDLTKRAIAVVCFGIASVAMIGCAADEPPTPTAVPLPPIVVDIGMTASTVLAPVNIDFEAQDFTDGATYFWDFGDGGSMSGTRARHTYLDAGTFVVRLTATRGDETQYVEQTITVQPGDAGWLILNAQALEIGAGETFQFEAEAYDHLGNRVSQPDLVWHADPAIGSIDQNGLFAAVRDIAFAAEGVRVEFSRGNFTANEKLPVSVALGEPTTIEVTPSTIDTRATWGVDMHAEVLDPAGLVLEDAEISWETLRPGDQVDQTGYYTPSQTISASDASLILITATKDGMKFEQIVKGTIHPGILDRLVVEGSLIDLKPGDEVQLSATGYDRFNNELELDEIKWEIEDEEAGSFDSDGLFTAGGRSGQHPENTVRVRGFKDGVQTFADVPLSILPAQAVAIEFMNETDSVPAGSSSPIPLRVVDEHGNDVTDVDVYLEVTSGGRLGVGNSFRAGFEPGVYEDAVVARVLPGSAGNDKQLEASTDIEVRQRSSDYLAIDIVGPRGAVVYLINMATGDLTPLSPEVESNEYIEDTPSWWPDGSRVVYSSDVNGNREIFDTDPFNGGRRLVATGQNDLIMPAISPDGRRIAFVESFEGYANIYVADLQFDENGDLIGVVTVDDARRLSADDGLQHLFPYWSPNGNLIMYTSTPGDGRFRIIIADVTVDFGETVAEATGASGLAWHRDGEQILVATRRTIDGEDRETLALVNLTSRVVSEIDAAGLKVGIAALSPDGSEISFVDEDEGALWLMDIDGTGLRRALGGQYQTTVTAWRPQPLQLPTPTDRSLGDTGLVVPDGDIARDRIDDAEHGTLGPYQVLLETDRGEVKIDLYNHLAPVTVQNFINLANAGYYDGLTFHTVEPRSAVFGGSKVNAFGGTAGYYIPSEFHPEASHRTAGTISMISKVVNGGSTEFVIALEPKADWDAFVDGEEKDCSDPEEVCYAVFGKVIEGLDVLMGFEETNRLSGSATQHRILKATVLDSTSQ